MSKTGRLFVVMSLVACVAFLMAPAALQAGEGAVKSDLCERQLGDPHDQVGSGPKVGWAIANTNANGQLIVQVHLGNGLPSQTFDVWVKVNGDHSGGPDVQLSTDSQGEGNAHVMVSLADYPPSTNIVDVQVVVKQTLAIVGYATATEPVPLKQ